MTVGGPDPPATTTRTWRSEAASGPRRHAPGVRRRSPAYKVRHVNNKLDRGGASQRVQRHNPLPVALRFHEGPHLARKDNHLYWHPLTCLGPYHNGCHGCHVQGQQPLRSSTGRGNGRRDVFPLPRSLSSRERGLQLTSPRGGQTATDTMGSGGPLIIGGTS